MPSKGPSPSPMLFCIPHQPFSQASEEWSCECSSNFTHTQNSCVHYVQVQRICYSPPRHIFPTATPPVITTVPCHSFVQNVFAEHLLCVWCSPKHYRPAFPYKPTIILRAGVTVVHTALYSFTEQTFTEQLLCTRHYTKHYDHVRHGDAHL